MNGDIARSELEPPSLPRKITMERGTEGYGFNLHGEKGIVGQFISAIDEGSPAQRNDLRVGDRVIAVNNEDVENLPHAKVVERIRAGGNTVTLLVVDEQCDQFYKSIDTKIPQDKFVTPGEIHPPPEAVENHLDMNVETAENPAESVDKESEIPAHVSVHEAPDVSEEASIREKEDDTGDHYDEVIPKTETDAKPEETPAEIPPEPSAVHDEVSSGTATTTTVNETTATSANGPASDTINASSKLDMAAARPKPKRNEVKRATQDWRQKYDDFNKL